jgi:tetratricopeptide (TPR) repeat protein
MQISPDSARERMFLLIVSCAIAAVLTFEAAQMWIANRRMLSGQLDPMLAGAALLPGNGEAWDRVGRFLQFDFVNPDPASAVSEYQKAVHDDPNSSYYWMDLASAYEDLGEFDRAQDLFQRAQAVYPISAMVAWNYGNFLVRRQKYSEGYAKIQEAVRQDPKLLPLAISRVWRSTDDVTVLLDRALPPTQEAYLQSLTFFTSFNQLDAGLVVWRRLVSLGERFSPADAFPFLDKLITGDRGQDAQRVWKETIAATGLPAGDSQNGSAVSGGNFVGDFALGGLGWRWDAPLGVVIGFDSPPAGKSGRSVRLDFGGGSNLSLDMPAQFVRVDPDRAYHFHSSIRTDQVTTESGVQFSISDPNHTGVVNAVSDNFTGSHPWTDVDLDIHTGPQTHFLLIRLVRYPSRLFENKLSGTAWIAGVSLAPANSIGLAHE